MPILFLLFVVVPALELYLLIQLSSLIGGFETFGVVVATGLLGSYMAKTQGLSVWQAINKKLASGAMPGDELTDGAIILVSGTLLITPGVLTDIVGLLGLIPWTRSLFRLGVKRFFKGRSAVHMTFGASGSSFSGSNPFAQSGMYSGFQTNPPSASSQQSVDSDAEPASRPDSTTRPGSSTGSGSASRPPVEVSGKPKLRPEDKP